MSFLIQLIYFLGSITLVSSSVFILAFIVSFIKHLKQYKRDYKKAFLETKKDLFDGNIYKDLKQEVEDNSAYTELLLEKSREWNIKKESKNGE